MFWHKFCFCSLEGDCILQSSKVVLHAAVTHANDSKTMVGKALDKLILKHGPSSGVGLLFAVIRYCRNTGTCCINFLVEAVENSAEDRCGQRSAEQCDHVVN